MNGHPLLAGLAEVRRYWAWFFALGLLLILLGAVALGAAWMATLVSILLFGSLLLVGGVAEIASAFWARRSGGLFLHLLGGVLDVVVGLLLMRHPDRAAAGLTLLLAAFFLVGGLFRAV